LQALLCLALREGPVANELHQHRATGKRGLHLRHRDRRRLRAEFEARSTECCLESLDARSAGSDRGGAFREATQIRWRIQTLGELRARPGELIELGAKPGCEMATQRGLGLGERIQNPALAA